jgi:hypothetical protein
VEAQRDAGIHRTDRWVGSKKQFYHLSGAWLILPLDPEMAKVDRMIEHCRVNDIGGGKREWLGAGHRFALPLGNLHAWNDEVRDDAELVMVVTRQVPQP